MKRFKKILKWAFFAGLLTVVLLALGNLWVNGRSNAFIFDEVADVPPARVAMVLGTSRYTVSGGNNLFFVYRMDAAAQLFHAGRVQKVLVSGDNSTSSYDEPNGMRSALMDRGVPASAIVLDYAGFRTFDSVVRTKKVFGQDEFVIVSQRFHLQRAIFIARSMGIKATGFQAKDPALRRSRIKVLVREFFARGKAILDCYILNTQPKFLGKKENI